MAMQRIATIIALVVALTACASGDTTDITPIGPPDSVPTTTPDSTTPPSSLPDHSDSPLVIVADEGGFVPVEFLIQRMPRFVVMQDGRLFYQGPIPEIFPGPALPNILVGRLDAQTVGLVQSIVDDMGLPAITDEANREAADRVADASDTVVTYFDDAGSHRFSVYALGLVSHTDARVQQVAKLMTLLDGASATIEAEPYVPERLQVSVSDQLPGFDPQFKNVLPWPLEADPRDGAPGFLEWPCSVVEGDDATVLYEALASANQTTTWEVDGTELGIYVRPLLPHESGC